MFCIKCGSKLPDGAKFCMNCGVAIDYKNMSNQENREEKREEENKESVVEVKDKEEKIYFTLVNSWTIRYVKDTEKVASLFGIFLKRAYDETNNLFKKYDDFGSIDGVLQNIPDMAQIAIDNALQDCLKILYNNNINMSAQQFIDKYYYEYTINYEPYYRDAVNRYAEIKKNKEALSAFRAAQKTSRSRWQGGGFGMSGAIKGAITASVMNIGTDFVRSFGDAATNRNDSRQIREQLKELYNDKKIRREMCWGVYWCIMNAFYSLIAELKSSGWAGIIELDEGQAETLFKNANQFADNREEYVEKVIKCILLFPGEKKFYDAIMPEIMKCEKEDFERFLKFWNIEFLFPDYKYKKCENIPAGEFFDMIFEEYKEKYEKENGKIDEVTPDVYYKVIRPCLYDYFEKRGYFNNLMKIDFGWIGRNISNESKYKTEFLTYISKIQNLNINGSFIGVEYISNIPKFDNIEAFFNFIYTVENLCLGETFAFTSDLGPVFIRSNRICDYHECTGEKILLSLQNEVDHCMITDKHLLLADVGGWSENCVIPLNRVTKIEKNEKTVSVYYGVSRGIIDFKSESDNKIIQFMDILYHMLKEYCGRNNLELKID